MTLEEAKESIARKEGHADWLTCRYRENSISMELLHDQAAELYASSKVAILKPTVVETEVDEFILVYNVDDYPDMGGGIHFEKYQTLDELEKEMANIPYKDFEILAAGSYKQHYTITKKQ